MSNPRIIKNPCIDCDEFTCYEHGDKMYPDNCIKYLCNNGDCCHEDAAEIWNLVRHGITPAVSMNPTQEIECHLSDGHLSQLKKLILIIEGSQNST